MSAVPNRPRNPRGEGARLRDQLLQATADLLNEFGDADRVSVRAIARRAGVSPTALYLQFPDRDALVAAAVDAGFAAFNTALLDAAATEYIRARDANSRRWVSPTSSSQRRRPALYAIAFSCAAPAGRAGRGTSTVTWRSRGSWNRLRA